MPYVILGVAIFILLITLLLLFWKSPHADEAIMITGIKPRTLIGKGSIVIPILEKTCTISLESIPLEVNIKESTSMGGLLVDVYGTAMVKVASSPSTIALAVEQFCQGSQKDTKAKIAESVTRVLIGQLRSIVATMTIDEIVSDMESFSSKVREGTADDLAKMGLELISYTLAKVDTPSSQYLENKAKQQEVTSKAEADIAIAEKKRDTEIKTADAEREGQKARLESDTLIAEAEKEKQLKIEEYRGVKAEATRKADAASELERIKQDEIIAKQEAQLAIQRAETTEKELLATEIKPAEARKQKEIIEAETQKQKQILNAEADAERRVKEAEALAKALRIKAEAEAEAVRIKAKAEAEKKTVEGQAEADVISARGRAEAIAIEEKGKAEAEAMKVKAEAYAKYGEVAMLDIIVEKLPQISENIAKPLSAIDNVTILGDGNNISKMSKAVLDGTTNVKEILKTTTGIDLAEVLQGLKVQQNKSIATISVDEEKEAFKEASATTTE